MNNSIYSVILYKHNTLNDDEIKWTVSHYGKPNKLLSKYICVIHDISFLKLDGTLLDEMFIFFIKLEEIN